MLAVIKGNAVFLIQIHNQLFQLTSAMDSVKIMNDALRDNAGINVTS